MVQFTEADLNATFGALADPTRRAILTRLAEGDTSVSELAEPFSMSLPAVAKHLRVLSRAGLIEHHKTGRVRRCTLVSEPLRQAAGWIVFYRRFWEQQFDSLEACIETLKQEDSTWHPRPTSRTSSASSARLPRRSNKSSRRGRTRS